MASLAGRAPRECGPLIPTPGTFLAVLMVLPLRMRRGA